MTVSLPTFLDRLERNRVGGEQAADPKGQPPRDVQGIASKV
jgi:hypothetical protein